MKLVSYARTSSSGNGEESLSAQEERMRAWAVAQGHTILEAFRDESVTGTLPVEDRPGLRAAVSALRGGCGDALLVPGLDRLAREVWQQEAALGAVWQDGGRVFEAGHGEVERDDPDDPTRKLLRLVMGAVWGFDRDIQVKRMRDGKRRKAAAGGYTGGHRIHKRYGYDIVDGEYVPVPGEHAAIERMRVLRAQRCGGRAHTPYATIARKLADEGWPAPTINGRWYAGTVGKVLAREGP